MKGERKFWFILGMVLVLGSILSYFFKIAYFSFPGHFSYLNPFGFGVRDIPGLACNCAFLEPRQLHYVLTDVSIIYWLSFLSFIYLKK